MSRLHRLHRIAVACLNERFRSRRMSIVIARCEAKMNEARGTFVAALLKIFTSVANSRGLSGQRHRDDPGSMQYRGSTSMRAVACVGVSSPNLHERSPS